MNNERLIEALIEFIQCEINNDGENFKPVTYSGRGMGGLNCLGVKGEFSELIELYGNLCIKISKEFDENEVFAVPCFDNMGTEKIMYFEDLHVDGTL